MYAGNDPAGLPECVEKFTIGRVPFFRQPCENGISMAARTTRRLWAAGLFFGAGLWAQNAVPPLPSSTWKALQFLVGTWEAKTEGGSAGAASSGTYTFQMELRGHVLARHTASAGCEGPARFDCEHTDLLYVYPEGPGNALKAIYFDNEGHVIHYEVTIPEANTAVFVSPALTTGPQYRLIYELKDRTMRGRFQMRMPGQSEFQSYLVWRGEKK